MTGAQDVARTATRKNTASAKIWGLQPAAEKAGVERRHFGLQVAIWDAGGEKEWSTSPVAGKAKVSE